MISYDMVSIRGGLNFCINHGTINLNEMLSLLFTAE